MGCLYWPSATRETEIIRAGATQRTRASALRRRRPQPTVERSALSSRTLCSFFKYVAGSFQPTNKFVSLAPSYKTNFDIHGQTASVYFECHYFNVAADPTAGTPLWTAASRVVFEGGARKVDGRWLFSHANAPAAGVAIP